MNRKQTYNPDFRPLNMPAEKSRSLSLASLGRTFISLFSFYNPRLSDIENHLNISESYIKGYIQNPTAHYTIRKPHLQKAQKALKKSREAIYNAQKRGYRIPYDLLMRHAMSQELANTASSKY